MQVSEPAMANTLADMFGSSPVQPLEKHLSLAYGCAKKLRVLVAAAMDRDRPDLRVSKGAAVIDRASSRP